MKLWKNAKGDDTTTITDMASWIIHWTRHGVALAVQLFFDEINERGILL